MNQPAHAPWVDVTRLPSMAAAAMERKADVAAKHCATWSTTLPGEYLIDLMRGLQDREAVDRVSTRVAELTSLDPALVRQLAGRIDMRTFQRELQRRNREVVSAYDTDVVGYDPNPTSAQSRFEDPVLAAMTAPLTSAIIDHLGRTLNYKPEGRYNLLNGSISGAWRWGRGRGQPENISELRQSLALDRKLRVLVAHGFTDLVTPYFASQLLLNQLPEFGPEQRLTLQVYDGGHMFYSRDRSRGTFRDDVGKALRGSLEGSAGKRGLTE